MHVYVFRSLAWMPESLCSARGRLGALYLEARVPKLFAFLAARRREKRSCSPARCSVSDGSGSDVHVDLSRSIEAGVTVAVSTAMARAAARDGKHRRHTCVHGAILSGSFPIPGTTHSSGH